jgi:heme-degrading monooxygenase HmoA
MRLVLSIVSVFSIASAACGSDPAPPATPTPTASPMPTPEPEPAPLVPGCVRGTLEPDFATFMPLGGPAVDPATGALRPPAAGASYVISSTYLALRGEPAAQQAFGELMGPISATLQAQPGLLAIQLAQSMSCGSARTLTVWESEDAMYAFVASPAHVEAMRRVGEVSRGESVVTHWVSSATTAATWDEAARQLRAHTGPRY